MPGGSYLAALATATTDGWRARSARRGRGNPVAAAVTYLSDANAEALQGYAAAAHRSGAAQRCVIGVPVPER